MAVTAQHFDTLRAAEELETAGLPAPAAKAISMVIDRSRESGVRESRIEKIENDILILNDKVERLDNKVEKLDSKIEKLDGRVGRLETKVERLDSKVERLDSKIEQLDGKMEKRITELETQLIKWTVAVGAVVTAVISVVVKL